MTIEMYSRVRILLITLIYNNRVNIGAEDISVRMRVRTRDRVRMRVMASVRIRVGSQYISGLGLGQDKFRD